jgi:choline-sulfatase
MDGQSLIPLAKGDAEYDRRPVISEFFAEGSIAPCFMVRQGRWKYIYSRPDPPQLYDLEKDPSELRNLASLPEYREIERGLKDAVFAHQDPEAVREAVLESQKRRRLVFEAGMKGKRTPWDYSPFRDAATQYMRNHLDLNEVESRARIQSKR